MTVDLKNNVKYLIALVLVALLAGLAWSGPGLASQEAVQNPAGPENDPQIITVTPRGAYARALTEARLGRHAEALELLDQLPGLVPDSLADDMAWRRAESLLALGRRAEALEQIKLCLELSPLGPRAEDCRQRLKELGGQAGEESK